MRSYESIPWGHRPFTPAPSSLYGAMHEGHAIRIVRIAVGDGSAHLQWIHGQREGICGYQVVVTRRGEGVGFARNRPKDTPEPVLAAADADSCSFERLINGMDYEVVIHAVDASGRRVARSLSRLFRCGYFPGTVVNYIHPDDYTFAFSGRSPASPSLVRLPSGALLVSHDVYWGGAGQLLTQLFRSEDEGASWRYVTDVCPCFWGKLFLHGGALYLMGVDSEYGHCLIGVSNDEGETWSRPVRILEGGSRKAGGPHQAPTPVIAHAGRLWTAIEWGSWDEGHRHCTGILSASLDADLLNPASWTVSPFVAHDPAWPGTVRGGNPQVLEGNVLPMPDGSLGNLLRYHTAGAEPDSGVAIMMSLAPQTPGDPQRFLRTVPLEGNYTKFFALHDAAGGRYYMLHNRGDRIRPFRRDILSLAVSGDAIAWHDVCDLINYRDNNWPEGPERTGFQYPSCIIDGDNLLAVVRTALNGAWNYHNANAVTFHRFERFRDWNRR